MKIISGVQPSGKLHLGNYFGAVKHHVELQDKERCIYFIADYHAMTTIQDAKTLRNNTLEIAADYLALGINPNKTILFKQSDVPQVTELAWILANVTGMGLLERSHSYKDKVEKGIAPNVGLFLYPILMAADILAYRADCVPVGQDQVQHLELTRDIAGRFNNTYGEVFPLPNYVLSSTPKVPGIDGQKMSKSYNNTIDVFLEGKQLKKVIDHIKTDSTPVGAAKDPNNSILFSIYELFVNEQDRLEMHNAFLDGIGYGEVKKKLIEKIDQHFEPARAARKRLSPKFVQDVLNDGALMARRQAEQTIEIVKEKVGL